MNEGAHYWRDVRCVREFWTNSASGTASNGSAKSGIEVSVPGFGSAVSRCGPSGRMWNSRIRLRGLIFSEKGVEVLNWALRRLASIWC